ncbi:hypothetical protein D3C78_1096900 [compost metagenome]
MRARTSALEQKLSSRSRPTCPSGISSMKLMSRPCSMAKSTSAGTSSALRPFITTAFSLMPVKPAACAASMPASTWRSSPVRVMARKRSGSRVSRLMFSRLSPASCRERAWRTSCEPLVVMHNSRSPGSAARRSHRPTMPGRTSGSPPVRRSLRTPRATKMRATRSISSRVSTCWRGRNCMSSAMQ